MIKKQLFF